MYLKPPRSREAFRRRNMQAKPTQKAKFPTQRDGPRVSGSSEKNARLGGLASVKGRRYLFSLKIKPLTLFLAYNRAEQVDFLGSRISSVGKICVLRGTSCTLRCHHTQRTGPLWSPLLLLSPHSPPTPLPDTKGFKAVSTQKLYSKLFSRAPNYSLFRGCCISWKYPGIPRQFFQYFI